MSTFDDRIFPLIARRFGAAPDVDGDGRFTVLISSWLDHLGGGRYAVDGFVRVADLERSVHPPLGNQCDVMYLSAALESGPHLRTVLAHEYMHAVAFGQKNCGNKEQGGTVQEEEGWLDEAIAHLTEDLCGFSTSNIDYRVNAFLAAPERYQLVVEDYYAADLFRSHGNRGSTYLFLRWCADRCGTDLVPTLVHSRLRGTANLEASTGVTFRDLYRGWTLDLARDLVGADAAGERGADERAGGVKALRAVGDWNRGGPRFTRLAAGSVDRWPALGTTSHYAIVDGSVSGAIEIEVSGPPAADLQVTAVMLGDDRPRLDLSVSNTRGANGELFVRAHIKERHGRQVQLDRITWEPLTPGVRQGVGAGSRGRLEPADLRRCVGATVLEGMGERMSQPIRLVDAAGLDGPVLVKAGGVDAKGRRIWAWAEVTP